VVEVGTHEALLQKGGYYSRLYSMQFADRAEVSTKTNPSFNRVSHELRTRLNSMIGFLGLLVDDLVDNSQERQELIDQSYNSALRVLNAIDLFSDVVNLKINWQSSSDIDQNQDEHNQYQNFSHISDEFRKCLYPIISSLRLLADKLESEPQKQNLLITESYQSAIYLLDVLKLFENQI
jgi:subfamily B ATP-binding cassette protein MsbA